jgi:iron complex outermembrane receptor protein
MNPLKPASRLGAISIAVAGALAAPSMSVHAAESVQDPADMHIDLPAVTVTANPLGVSADELVPPVSVLNGNALMLQQNSTLGETLNGTPGVHSSYFGPNASRPVIRGLDGDRIRVLQNGVGALDASSLSPDHAVPIDPLAVEQIDVVRGPAALQYGGSAVGGVVNTIDNRIPRDPIEGISGRAETRIGGADNEHSTAGLVEAGNGTFAIHADGYMRDTDNLDIPGYARSARLRRTDPQPDEARGTLPNSASESKGGAIGFSLTGDRGYAGLSFSQFDSTYGTVAEPNVHIDMRSSRVDFAGELRDIGSMIERVKVRLAHVDYQHQEVEGSTVGTTFSNQGWEGSIEATHGKLGPLSGVIGMQLHRSNFDAEGDEALIPKTQTDSKAVYIYEEMPFPALDALKLSFGTRVERVSVSSDGGGPDDPNTGLPRFGIAEDRSFTPVSFSGGALYRLSETWALSGNLSHSERAPTYYELYSNGPHAATGQYEIGDSTLGVEKSNGLDMQLRWHQGPANFSVTGFYTRFQNYIAPFNTGNFRDTSGNLVGAGSDALAESIIKAVPAVFKGFEFAAKTRLSESIGTLDLRFKGDYVRATNSNNGDPLPRISPLRLGVGLDYALGRVTSSLDVTRNFAQHRIAENETPTDSYTMVNATLNYHWPTKFHIDTFAKATNLLNQDAREHTSVLKDIAPLGGRAVLFGLKAEF